jgi:3-oxosteroid 1-dehydrogenase
MEAYIDNGNKLVEWTRDEFGWEWDSGDPNSGFKDYYEPYKGFRAQGKDAPLPDNIFQADTLEEIANHFGIDAAALEGEVAAFNANALEGVDPAFHRGEKKGDLCIGAYHPYAAGELKNPVLAPVATPPFYASLYVPGTCGTNGGLKINEFAQVLDTKGEVIPGLYAVGNCTASISGGQYCGAGMTVGGGSVMAYIGARKALGIA